MQAKKAPSEDATIKVGADFAFDEASNGCSLLACISEERVECLSDDFVEKRFSRLVTLVVGHVDPVRDRVGAPATVGHPLVPGTGPPAPEAAQDRRREFAPPS
jgi:hypothetical protein